MLNISKTTRNWLILTTDMDSASTITYNRKVLSISVNLFFSEFLTGARRDGRRAGPCRDVAPTPPHPTLPQRVTAMDYFISGPRCCLIGVKLPSCGIGWVHVTRARGIWQGEGSGHVAGAWDMLQGVVASGRGKGGDMWQGVGHVAGGGSMCQGVGLCDRGRRHVAGVSACDKGYGHMAGGGMGTCGGGICSRVWGHVVGMWACGRG